MTASRRMAIRKMIIDMVRMRGDEEDRGLGVVDGVKAKGYIQIDCQYVGNVKV
jgi:hypothetical protein